MGCGWGWGRDARGREEEREIATHLASESSPREPAMGCLAGKVGGLTFQRERCLLGAPASLHCSPLYSGNGVLEGVHDDSPPSPDAGN